MPRRRPHHPTIGELPPLLIRVVRAADHADDDPVERTGHGAALTALGHWALIEVPCRGVLAPAESHAYATIEAVARRHLDYRQAAQAFRKALAVIGDTAQRDSIEDAENWLRSVSDTAYYYSGLASGITLAELAGGRCELM